MDLLQTVYVVDDDKAVRESLQWLIESAGLRAQTFESGQAFLDFCHEDMSGCLVVDIRMPGLSGLDMYDRMIEQGYDLATIVITGHGDVPQAVRALKSGALDFFEKPFSDHALLDRVHNAMRIDRENRDTHSHQQHIRERYDRLTPREKQVMSMVVEGQLNKQIAGNLGLSHKTIEVHRSHVMQKMAAPSLPALVRMAATLEAAGVFDPVQSG